MSFPELRAWSLSIAHLVRGVSAAMLLGVCAAPAFAQVPPPNPNGPKANWALYDKFSTQNMRGMTFSTSITPRWIGETDSIFYSWKDHTGEHWILVNAVTHAKKPLFDQVKLAAQLSVLRKKSIDAYQLDGAFTTMNITKDHKNLRFEVDSMRYNWVIATEVLTSMGRYRAGIDTLMIKDEEVEVGGGGGRGGRGGGGGAVPPGGRGNAAPDFRNWSPDSTAFVFARNHNLFIYEKAKGDTTQITTDGIPRYSFAGGGGRGGGGQQDTTQQQQQQVQEDTLSGAAANRPSRPAVTWSPDSRAFYITRADTRGVKDLYLVRSLTEPRPTLMQYSYPMPGEDSIRKPEIWTYIRGNKAATKAPIAKWLDQAVMSGGAVFSGVGGGRGGGGGGGAGAAGGGPGLLDGQDRHDDARGPARPAAAQHGVH